MCTRKAANQKNQNKMSADEDSFIVIEETPSMLQFSLLDSITSNRSNDQGKKPNDIVDETNSSLFASALSPSHTNSVEVTSKSDKKDENVSLHSIEMMHSNVSNASANTHKSFEMNGLQMPSPKSTLAHSFLLGDINCDIMKVKTILQACI